MLTKKIGISLSVGGGLITPEIWLLNVGVRKVLLLFFCSSVCSLGYSTTVEVLPEQIKLRSVYCIRP